MHRVTKAFCISLIVASLPIVAPTSALACSVIAEAITSSLPVDGALDVPIDVAPIIRGHWYADGIVWEGPGGSLVEFALVNMGRGKDLFDVRVAELKPRSPLQANTRYVIRAQGLNSNGQDEMRIAFTTSTSVADEISLDPPVLAASVLTRRPDPSCILENAVACVSVDGPSTLFELANARGDVLVRDVFAGNVFTYIDDPECVRVWRRSAAGQLSKPTELCGEKLSTKPATRELDGTYMCRDGAFRPSDGRPSNDDEASGSNDTSQADAGSESEAADVVSDEGCSLASGERPAATLVFALLALCALRGPRSRTLAARDRDR